MEPTIYLSFLFTTFFSYYAFFDTKYQYNFLFLGEIPRKEKEKIVGGEVRVAKAIGIFILYIGGIRFVINRPVKGKRITERKN